MADILVMSRFKFVYVYWIYPYFSGILTTFNWPRVLSTCKSTAARTTSSRSAVSKWKTKETISSRQRTRLVNGRNSEYSEWIPPLPNQHPPAERQLQWEGRLSPLFGQIDCDFKAENSWKPKGTRNTRSKPYSSKTNTCQQRDNSNETVGYPPCLEFKVSGKNSGYSK